MQEYVYMLWAEQLTVPEIGGVFTTLEDAKLVAEAPFSEAERAQYKWTVDRNMSDGPNNTTWRYYDYNDVLITQLPVVTHEKAEEMVCMER